MRTYPTKVGIAIIMQKHDNITLAYKVHLYLLDMDNSTTPGTLPPSTLQSDSEGSSESLHSENG